jgi:hypothetical protein
MRPLFFRRLSVSLCLAAAALAASGCWHRPSASASGRVTLTGVPLKGHVLLTFVGPDNTPRSTRTDANGAFAVSGLDVGETRVTLVSVPEGGPATRELVRATQGAPGARPASTAATSRSEVPAEYGDATNPRVTCTLREGENSLTVDLQPLSK